MIVLSQFIEGVFRCFDALDRILAVAFAQLILISDRCTAAVLILCSGLVVIDPEVNLFPGRIGDGIAQITVPFFRIIL